MTTYASRLSDRSENLGRKHLEYMALDAMEKKERLEKVQAKYSIAAIAQDGGEDRIGARSVARVHDAVGGAWAFSSEKFTLEKQVTIGIIILYHIIEITVSRQRSSWM